MTYVRYLFFYTKNDIRIGRISATCGFDAGVLVKVTILKKRAFIRKPNFSKLMVLQAREHQNRNPPRPGRGRIMENLF